MVNSLVGAGPLADSKSMAWASLSLPVFCRSDAGTPFKNRIQSSSHLDRDGAAFSESYLVASQASDHDLVPVAARQSYFKLSK